MPVTGLDHLVLAAEDVDRLCEFYDGLDGIEVVTFGSEGRRRALQIGDQKINVRDADFEHELVAERPTAGSGDVCILTDTPLSEVRRELTEKGIEIIEGPVDRPGADRPIRSIYITDPEGNLVEFANVRE